jgi:hypothetical protein
MTIFGNDCSHFDAPDTRPMFADGITFQTHKAGGDKDDAELGQWWTYVRGYRDRVLLGAYWVLYPGRPAARAEAFIARLDSQCPGWRDAPFILQADCEKWNGDPGTVPSIAEINAFCDRLVQLAPKLRPIGYLPPWVYPNAAAFRYPLWASRYGSNPTGHYRELYPGDSSLRWSDYGHVPAILQYGSNTIIGNQTTCDANAFRGTLAELTALAAPGWAQEGNDLTMDQAEFNAMTIKAYKDPAVQGAFNTMLAGAISNIQSYDFADGKTPHGIATLNELIGAADNTSGGRVEKRVTDIDAKLDRLTEDLLAHFTGIKEGIHTVGGGNV